MLNKNDPLIGVVQEVMKRNHAEREAAKAVNEKFGITDRKALPHERQHEWNAAYQQILSEATNPSNYSEKQKKLAKVGNKAGLGGNPKKIDPPDLAGARMGHAKHIEESGEMGPVKAKENAKSYKHKKSGKEIHSVKHPGDEWELIKEAPVDDVGKGENEGGSAVTTIVPKPKPKPQITSADQKALGDKVKSIKEENLEEKAKWRDNPNAQTPGGYAKGNTGEDPLARNPGMGLKGPKGGKTNINRLKDKIRAAKHFGSHKKRNLPEETLDEKAVSKAQHRFFGLVRGIQKGKAHGSAKAEKAAKSMSAKSVRDYAKTSEKGLPEKVNEATIQTAGQIRQMAAQPAIKKAAAIGATHGGQSTSSPKPAGVQPGLSAPRAAAPVKYTPASAASQLASSTTGQAAAASSVKKVQAGGSGSLSAPGGARPSPNIGKNTPSAGPGTAQKAFDAGQAAKAKAAEPKTMGAALKAAAARGEKVATFGGKKYKVAFKDKAYQGRMEKKGAAFKSRQQVGQAQRARPAGAPTQAQNVSKSASAGPARPAMAVAAKAAGQMAVTRNKAMPGAANRMMSGAARQAGQMAINRMKAQRSAVAQTPSMSAGMSRNAPPSGGGKI